MRTGTRDGLLLVDKPAGLTSHDVVTAARRSLGERRIGHLGTLDPFATGLLVLLIGRATRIARYLDSEPKVYAATIRFGTETDTDDRTGAPVRSAPPPDDHAIADGIAALTGPIDQTPPLYSAKKVKGRRAYAMAREGVAVELEPVRVTVHDWTLHRRRGDELEATITCSGGTYVRALARDLGRRAGSAAHLAELRRVKSGTLDVRDALPFERLPTDATSALRSPREALALPTETLDAGGVERVTHGLSVPATAPGARAALIDGEGALIAIAEREGDAWQPRVVLRGS